MKKEIETQETQETQENNESVGWQVFSNQPRYATFNNKKEKCDCEIIENGNKKHFQFLSRWYCGRLASKISFLQEMIAQDIIAPDSIVYVYANGNQCEITMENNEKYVAQSTGNIYCEKLPDSVVASYKMKNNIVLVYDKDKNIIYTNMHNETKKKYAVAINFLQKETSATIKSGCNFPFIVETRNTSGKMKKTDSLETVLKKAVAQENEIEM